MQTRSGIKKRKLCCTLDDNKMTSSRGVDDDEDDGRGRLVKLFSALDTVLIYMTSCLWKKNGKATTAKQPALFNLHQVKMNVERSCKYHLSVSLLDKMIEIYPGAFEIKSVHSNLSTRRSNKENKHEMDMLIGLPSVDCCRNGGGGLFPDPKSRLDEFTARLDGVVGHQKQQSVLAETSDNNNMNKKTRGNNPGKNTPRLEMIMKNRQWVEKNSNTATATSTKPNRGGGYSSLLERIRAKEQQQQQQSEQQHHQNPLWILAKKLVVPILHNLSNENNNKRKLIFSLDQLSMKISTSCCSTRLTPQQAKECLLLLSTTSSSWLKIIHLDGITALQLLGKPCT